MKNLLPIFVSVFLAELSDKTQLATLLFATDQQLSRVGVFVAASAALVVSTFLAVVFGELIGKIISPNTLRVGAACGFIAIGVWMLVRGRA